MVLLRAWEINIAQQKAISRWAAKGGFSAGGKAREEKPSLNKAREKQSRQVEMARNRNSVARTQ